MTRRVEWSREALDDFKHQIDYIADRNEAAARRVADRIRSAGDALGATRTGRPGRMPGTYEKSVTGLPYIIAYSAQEIDGSDTVSILRVIHTARDWPRGRWPR